MGYEIQDWVVLLLELKGEIDDGTGFSGFP